MPKALTMCKVSVIVPAYNAERYIRECLDSILKQSLAEIEIICVNDGSTDRTRCILHEYELKDTRIRVIHQNNAGYGHAVNVGIRAAAGEYVGIVEADDYVEPGMYWALWNTARKYTLDFVKSDYSYFKDTQTKRIFDRMMICPRLRWYYWTFNPSQTPALLDVDMMNVTGIYKREFLLSNRITLQETPGAAFQDTGLWFQIFLHGKRCMFLPHSFYRIRRDNPDSSVMTPGRFSMICQEYAQIHQILKNDRNYSIFAPYLFKRKVYAYLFILDKSDEIGKRQMLRRLSGEIQEAVRLGEYNQALFTSSMNWFLEQVRNAGEAGELSTCRSGLPWRRALECLREHGIPYTLRRLLIRMGIQKEIF